MPRPPQRSAFLANIIKVMEQVIRLIKYDSGKDLIEMLEELWLVYTIISARRYISSRGISAGRFGCSLGILLLDRYFAVLVGRWLSHPTFYVPRLVTALESAVMGFGYVKSWVMTLANQGGGQGAKAVPRCCITWVTITRVFN